jgi:hypothetical protein
VIRKRGSAGALAGLVLIGSAGAGLAASPDDPVKLGFQRYYKCPDGRDVTRLGDTGTASACLAACLKEPGAAGCWWLDGSNGFPRQCRVCRTQSPVREIWPNDWGISLKGMPVS